MKPETAALLLRLALATENCPDPVCPERLSGRIEDTRPICSICRGTGKVPLFPDEVRAKCPHTIPGGWESSGSTDAAGRMPQPDVGTCSLCQGRGWVPKENPMVWVKAFFWLGDSISFEAHPEASVEWDWYETAILAGDFDGAIAHAVKALELIGVLEVAHETTS